MEKSSLLAAFTKIAGAAVPGNYSKESSLNFIPEVTKHELYTAKQLQGNILKDPILVKLKCRGFHLETEGKTVLMHLQC